MSAEPAAQRHDEPTRSTRSLSAPWRQVVCIALAVAIAITVVKLTKPADFTAAAPVGADEWHARGQRPAARGAPAKEVAAYFAGLTRTQTAALAAKYPYVVSGLDGAPLKVRMAASRELISRYPSLRAYRNRQILSLDPRGPAHASFVVGDLSRAKYVAIVVTGDDTQVSHAEDTLKKLQWADDLYARAGKLKPGVAVVFWAGYTSPTGLSIESMRSHTAQRGAERFAQFVAGLRQVLPARSSIHLVCHSYGSLVCSYSLKQKQMPEAASLVLLGSPGLDVSNVSELAVSLPTYAALAEKDWIGDVPEFRWLSFGHGLNPADPNFGATKLPTGGVEDHDGYLTPKSQTLAVVAKIVVGSPPEQATVRSSK